jgi:hypothetical protein
MENGWPEKYSVLPDRLEQAIDFVAKIGGLLVTHILWDTEGRASDHRKVMEVGDDQHERQLLDEWRKQDLQRDVAKQLRIPYDSEGSWSHLD